LHRKFNAFIDKEKAIKKLKFHFNFLWKNLKCINKFNINEEKQEIRSWADLDLNYLLRWIRGKYIHWRGASVQTVIIIIHMDKLENP
jgi:hypothetical protein